MFRVIDSSGRFNAELGSSQTNSLRMAIQIEVENRPYYGVPDWRHHSAQAEQSDERVLLISFS
jgi:hypothetical protein